MSQRRNRATLVAIAVLFFAPLLLAVLMQSHWWSYGPAETVNRGTLVQPPVPVQGDGGAPWRVVHVLEASCVAACERAVTGLRQMHIAAGRHREAITVELVGEQGLEEAERVRLQAIYRDFVLTAPAPPPLADALAEAARRAWPEGGEQAGRSFLIDPRGNIILAYARGTDPNDLYRDLQRLLKWSPQE